MAETDNATFRAAVPDEDPVVALLRSVHDERLRGLAAMMDTRTNERTIDAEDARLLRLLLDEYTAAVRQVRAAAQVIEARLNAAASTVRAGRRVVRRTQSTDTAADGD